MPTINHCIYRKLGQAVNTTVPEPRGVSVDYRSLYRHLSTSGPSRKHYCSTCTEALSRTINRCIYRSWAKPSTLSIPATYLEKLHQRSESSREHLREERRPGRACGIDVSAVALFAPRPAHVALHPASRVEHRDDRHLSETQKEVDA